MPQGEQYVAEMQVDYNPDGARRHAAAGQSAFGPGLARPCRKRGARGAEMQSAARPAKYAPYFEQWRTKTVHFDPENAMG